MGQLYLVIRRDGVYECVHQVSEALSIIGREENSQIPLPDRMVSRKHAELRIKGGRFLIRDLKSRNGTYLNGRRLDVEEVLENGAELLIGPYLLNACFSRADTNRDLEDIEGSTIRRFVPVGPQPTPARDPLALTPSQHEVLNLLIQGLREKNVASRLGISIHTVHSHAKAIYKAFSVSSRGELISQWISRHNIQINQDS